MASHDVLIPQIGEGLQEVVVLAFAKIPGDFVKRDDILYSMETDKAVMEVESPCEGVLIEWLAREGEILPIGAPIARIEAEHESETRPTKQHSFPRGEGRGGVNPAGGPPPAELAQAALDQDAERRESARRPSDSGALTIPPRTRAYCKEHGISDDEMRAIPSSTAKLMPTDVDAYLAGKQQSGPVAAAYIDRPLSPQQRLFVHRLKRSAQMVVPATMKMVADWGALASRVDRMRARATTVKPTEFQMFAYCVASVIGDHPRFRSVLDGDDNCREYAHLNLGIAVARPNNDLVTAVVPDADTLTLDDFLHTAQERIKSARDGDDQAAADTQLHLTYMGAYGVVDAVPVLVAPATAVMFIGSPCDQDSRRVTNLVLTFDHRLINGVEAALFLRAVVDAVEEIGRAVVDSSRAA